MAGLRISTRGRYGLRLMMELSARYGEGPVLVDTIAASQDISSKYLHVLANGLRTAGLVLTTRGPSGGYALARDPAQITAAEVVTALEGELAPVECLENPTCCPRTPACAARDIWDEVAKAARRVLEKTTLAELTRRQRAKEQVASFDI